MKLFSCFAILHGLIFVSNLHAEEIAIIVNETGPLVNLSEITIRDIYLGEKKFEGGVRIEAINYPEGPVKDAFFQAVLKMTSREFKLHWTKKLFGEGGELPLTETDPRDIIEAVKKKRGAIGYVMKGELRDSKGVKVIKGVSR
ncbi:MAG: hypothetical protein HY036_02235 [Nitrospirae bacterium]|nr:hypothetical protein [Nitrospirota bacterium]MBI3351376.1 hypothetical protein [Nitrospirota bacterium]